MEGLLKDRLEQGRERLEEAREADQGAVRAGGASPWTATAYLRYFFVRSRAMTRTQLKDNEPKRLALYKLSASYLRAYANLANEMARGGLQ